MRMSGGNKHLVVATTDRQTGELIRQQLQKSHDDGLELQGRNSSTGSRYDVDLDTNISDSERAALNEKVKQKQVDGVIWAPDEALAANKISYITRDVSNLNDLGVQQIVSRAIGRRALVRKGLSEAEIDSALKPVKMEIISPAGTGAKNPLVAFFSVFGMVMVMYMTVLLYGMNVMRAVLDEKTSRIIEVMLSTATPKDMMIGKILGVGAVGLTQVGIWTATTGVLSQGLSLAASGALKGIVSVKLAVFFPVFFLLGFLLYSTLYAAIGAMVNSEQEAQQLQFLVAMPLIASIIVLVQILQNPTTPLATWASIFPLTAPLVMFTRIALDQTQSIPPWQIALSIGLLIATIYGLMVLCGRIYRIGILMYGKKPTLPEIMKWIRYA
jgi:ABC-2 type transport system permease protein